MARVFRGQYAGRECEIIQWSNMWFFIDIDGETLITSPLSIELDIDERVRWRSNSEGMNSEYMLRNDGHFLRKVN